MYISFLVLSLLNFLPYGTHFFPINLTVQEESQFPSVKGQQLRYPIYFDTRTPMTDYQEHHPLFKDQPIPQFKQDRVVIYKNFLTVEGVYHLQIPHFITEVRSSRIAGFINFNNPDLRKDVSQNINY